MPKVVLAILCSVITAVSAVGQAVAQGPPKLYPVQFMSPGGFCSQGTIPQLKWQLAEHVDDATIWGSFCNSDSRGGSIESATFLAPTALSFFLAGYIHPPATRLFLRNSSSGEEFDLRPSSNPGDQWQQVSFALPASWAGKPVRIVGQAGPPTLQSWFAFSAPRLSYAEIAAGYIATDGPQSGFCPTRQGEFAQVVWSHGSQPPGIVAWRSYCGLGDNNVGWMASEPFPAGADVTLYVSGYAGTPGVRLAVENLVTHEQLPLELYEIAAERWRLYHFPLPAQWKGQPVRVLAEDRAARPGGWLGFAVVPSATSVKRISFGIRLLLLLVAIFIVTLLPPTAVATMAVRKGIEAPLDLVAIGLSTTAFVGYAAFFVYLLSPALGVTFSYLVLLSSVAVVVLAAARAPWRKKLAALRRLVMPVLALFSASVFIVSLGFLNDKPDVVQEYAAYRFGPPPLSVDNFIPKLLADGLYEGKIPKPLIGNWLSSDRPPLQSGIALTQYPLFHGNRDLSYQLLGVILQLTALVALWAYLQAAGVNRKVMALALVTAFFSGFTIFNSFYVWPKLLPAAFLTIIAAYLFTARYGLVRANWKIGALIGAAAAVAMLSHGGSIFGLLGILLTMLLLRRVPSARFLLAVASAAVVLYLPWSLYQKYYDPPGDRLLKMHLAGVVDPHPELKLKDLLIHEYEKLGWRETWNYKVANLKILFLPMTTGQRLAEIIPPLLAADQQQRFAAVGSLREGTFLYWFWSIDLLSLGPFALLLCLLLGRRASPEFQQSAILWLCTAVTLVIWCLLMLGPARTVVHQGCYFTEMAAFAAGIMSLWTLSRPLTVFITACHILLALTIYVFLAPPQPAGFASYLGAANPVLGFFAVLSALAFVFVMWHMAEDRPDEAGNHEAG